MKKIIRLTESDLKRIVNRVINETEKQYLNEQSSETFIWAEDEESNENKTQSELNEINSQRLEVYYGTSEGQTNPDTLLNKIAYVFKKVSDPKNQFVYLKSNAYNPNGSFKIQKIRYDESQEAVKLMTENDVKGPFVRLSISPVSLQQGRVKLFNKFDDIVGEGHNKMFTYMYPFIQSNPKYSA